MMFIVLVRLKSRLLKDKFGFALKMLYINGINARCFLDAAFLVSCVLSVNGITKGLAYTVWLLRSSASSHILDA